jgi:hypothetical protein
MQFAAVYESIAGTTLTNICTTPIASANSRSTAFARRVMPFLF